jgi:hypothetical protein
MPLDLRWVDRLHQRLLVRYGSRWTSLWAGVDPQLVRADWSDVLDGISPEGISYALAHLPPEFPPSAMQFRALAASRPASTAHLALPPPRGECEMGDEVRQRIEAAQQRANPQRLTPAQCVLRNILARVNGHQGGKWSTAQRDQVQRMHDLRLVDASAHGFVRAEQAATAEEAAA